MSKLRPELTSGSTLPCMKNGTAYLMILNAVRTKNGLVHGQLRQRGESCAIGSYFDINKTTCLPSDLIDEVAAVNDSMPTLTMRVRKQRMVQWLQWKLAAIGMPGYVRPVVPAKGRKGISR